MTRARDSEEVGGVEEEKTTNIVSSWDSPDLSEDLVDRIYDMVRGWLTDREPAASDFFHYCLGLCESQEEDNQAWVWMLNLIAHFVAKDESWLDSIHTAKDWRQLGLSDIVDYWEVPPPLWLVEREEEGKKEDEKKKESAEVAASSLEEEESKDKEEKNKEKTEESLENVPTSPLDPNWGKGLPAPTPVVAAPFTPMWRPWEEEENVVVHLSAEVQKRKRRSPAAEARSRQRLLQWQQKRDRHRLQLESRNTPHQSIETSKTWTRLTKRLENEHILNICKGGGAESGAGGGGAAGKTVLYCDQTKTILHPQLLQSPLSSFPPVTSSSSGTSDSRWQAGCSNCLKNMQSLPCLSLQAPT